MTDLLASPPGALTVAPDVWPNPSIRAPYFGHDVRLVLPAGALRIGGDSPSGLVLSGGAPAARTVRLYDMETGALVAETTSAGDGTYTFGGLSARPEGYAVWIMGAAGERGIIIQGLHPGSP